MFCLSSAARAKLLLTACAWAGAARVPDVDTIGADVLVGTALTCDIPDLRRLFASETFSASWLTNAGSKGWTPLMAAVRSGCPEIVALLMLHPGFDDKTVKKERQRKALAEHAKEADEESSTSANWAMTIVNSIVISKVFRQELKWDMVQAIHDGAWFLPVEGEWMPQLTLTEIRSQIGMPQRPARTFSDYTVEDSGGTQLVQTEDGTFAIMEAVEQLWYLLLVYVQSAEDSPKRKVVTQHMRSWGWTLFFSCSSISLTYHIKVLRFMAESVTDIPPDDDEVHKHMRTRGDVREQYRTMPSVLESVWNKTGDWIILEEA